VPLEKLAERPLQAALTASSLPHGVLTVDEFHHMLEGMAEGWEKLPNLPTESLSRESFYEDRLDGRDAKQSELFFKEFRPPVCFLRRKSVAVAIERATFCEV
jgi:hypothetical protein